MEILGIFRLEIFGIEFGIIIKGSVVIGIGINIYRYNRLIRLVLRYLVKKFL